MIFCEANKKYRRYLKNHFMKKAVETLIALYFQGKQLFSMFGKTP
jgi:hypothetical protein